MLKLLKLSLSVACTLAIAVALYDLLPNGMWLQLAMLASASVGFTLLVQDCWRD